MGIAGFLQFSLKCVDLFAWPIFALAYPLCASIRAIETTSKNDMRKLVTYWILFSLISLFELSFAKFIEWFPLWSYIKIIAICWLVIPSFTRAYHAYKSLVQLHSYANLQVLINWLNKQDEEHFLKTEETFMSVVEKYIKENGTDALEELIATELKFAKPNLDAKEKIAVTITEEKELATTIEVKRANANFAETKKKIAEAVEVKEMKMPAAAAAAASGENYSSSLDNVQTQWTCAACQVITTSETILNSHLQGKKHIAKCEELKERKQTPKTRAVYPRRQINLKKPIKIRTSVNPGMG